MLTRRLQSLLNVAERLTHVRFYLASNNVHSNLRSRINLSRNVCYSSRKSVVSVSREHEWINRLEKRDEMILRACHTETVRHTSSNEKQSENTCARNLLVNSERGLKTFATSIQPLNDLTDDETERLLTEDWQSSSGDEILRAFERLSFRANLKAESLRQDKHKEILHALNGKLSSLDDDKFRRVFQCLCLWKDIMTFSFPACCPAYVALFKALDRESLKRLSHWSTEEALLMCDYWYQLRLTKRIQYPMIVLTKLGKNPKKLEPNHFLHFLFVINTCRKPPINMYEVEYRLDSIVDEFTANELGVVAMGFFKSQTPLRDEMLVGRILLKMLKELNTMEDVSIGAIMKIVRYSAGLRTLNILQDVLTNFISHVPRLSIPCLTNVVHAAAYVQCFNPELMNAVIDKFERQIDGARLKDLERLTWALNIFDYDPETPIFQKTIDSLRDPNRAQELATFPAVIPTLLAHLSQSNIFPIDLIKQHFDIEFLQRVYDNNAYRISYDYFTLENNLRIDMPEYDGPFLNPKVRDFLGKKFLWSKFHTSERVRPSDVFVLEVAHMCKTILQSETSIAIDQVLPQYVKPDIIICLNETNTPMDPEPIISQIPTGQIKYVPPKGRDFKWIAIVLAAQNQIITGTNRYIGPMRCKVRQLEKIGYTPILVNVNEWGDLQTLEAKERFLREKLRLATDCDVSAAVL